jgi:hypothetical protein
MPDNRLERSSEYRRPLYVVPTERLRLLSEGESLAVYRELTLRARYPIGQVDRIVCNRHVDWAGTALTLCLSRQISIFWIDGKGEFVGRAVPRYLADPEWAALFVRYGENPDCAFLFDNWLRRQRNQSWRSALARSARIETTGAARALDQMRRDFVYGGRLPFALETLRVPATAFVAAQLLESRVPECLYPATGRAVALPDRLAEVMIVDAGLAGTSMLAGATLSLASATFEGWTEAAGGRLVELLGSLRAHIARETLQCP